MDPRLRINPDILSSLADGRTEGRRDGEREGLQSAGGLADKSPFKYRFLLVMTPSEGRVDRHVPRRSPPPPVPFQTFDFYF